MLCLQVSSYGGVLRYELHSEAQRGDVFIPTESRPDVVLQVAGGMGVAGRAVGIPGQDGGQLTASPHLPAHPTPQPLPRATR